jgi:hypothetical protein
MKTVRPHHTLVVLLTLVGLSFISEGQAQAQTSIGATSHAKSTSVSSISGYTNPCFAPSPTRSSPNPIEMLIPALNRSLWSLFSLR